MDWRGGWRVGIGLVLAVGAGCSESGGSRAPARPRGPANVLLIVVDTLRADKVGCYGSPLGLTPAVDALAGQGVRFERAYAQAPWTLPSFASLYTSLNPPEHGAGGQRGQWRGLPEAARTVAECFRDAGHATACVINVDFVGEKFGLTQGFADVDFEGYQSNTQVRSATRTSDAALAWLRGRPDRPFFLLVHYFDPHAVYDPPAEWRRKFAAPEDRADPSFTFGTQQEISLIRFERVPIDEPVIRRAEKLYEAEIAYTDHEVGRLLAGLTELQLDGSTVVVFTADHGEEFLEHGSIEHGHTLYDEVVRVPLILRDPRWLKPQVIGVPVGLIDVAPTLCALAQVPPGPAFAGRDLCEVIEDAEPVARPLVMDGNFWGPPHRGWLHDLHKLIVGPRGTELYDLQVDPHELADLSRQDPKRLRAMLADLQLAYKTMQARGVTGIEVQLDSEEIKRLRSLGYLE